jgi:hypothetical protein
MFRWILRRLAWVAARLEDAREWILNVVWTIETIVRNRPK